MERFDRFESPDAKGLLLNCSVHRIIEVSGPKQEDMQLRCPSLGRMS
jgi:hypothetical protein